MADTDELAEDGGPRPSERSLRGLDWLNFFVADVQTGFGPFVSVYLAANGWSQGTIGTVLTVGSLTGIASQLPGGALVDAVKRKRGLIAAALAMIAAGAAIFAFSSSFPFVLVAEVLHGATAGLVKPALAAIGLGLVGHGALSRRLGRNHRYDSFGNAATAALMGALGHFVSMTATFFAAVALCLPAGWALTRIRGEEIDYSRARLASDRRQPRNTARLRELAKNHLLLIFGLCLVLFQFSNASVLPLATERLAQQHQHESELFTSALVIIPQVVTALLATWVGHRADVWGRKPLLLVGFGTLPVRAVLFSLAPSPWFLLPVQVLGGLTAAVIGVLTPLVIADLTRGTGRYNLAQGAVGTASGIGASLSTDSDWFFGPGSRLHDRLLRPGARGARGACAAYGCGCPRRASRIIPKGEAIRNGSLRGEWTSVHSGSVAGRQLPRAPDSFSSAACALPSPVSAEYARHSF